ncbi:Cytokine IL1/FGF,Fibroblast growth factor family [Cinara cedri]|uniref:Fibroblast growth factor n=1 Tax=Cinara cedri TaxID=506608 RepID=A0A5E4MAC9_9HEMI|nr:Cytokine IL1/FGF,Fibroblast growth factor family [Cinara cedri]
MVKRSRVYCRSGSSGSGSGSGVGGGGGWNRCSSFVVTIGVLVLYIFLCSGSVLGASLGDDRSTQYAAAVVQVAERTAGVSFAATRYTDDAAAAVAGTPARSGRSAANLSHITGTARKIKMFIKNRYLQVFPDGTVNSTAEDTSDYAILQRTSVNIGQLKIQGVATCMYLCMDACGLLYGSKNFEEECVFNEMIEQHHYNTYSSAKYTNDRRTLYLALNKRGMPRKVQVKANAPLGKLSTYTRVLTQSVSAERVEQLLASRQPPASGEWPASVPHGHRHHHVCPPHVGPPHPSTKRRKCPGTKGGGRKKNKDADSASLKGDGGGNVGSREDEDCGGGNKKNRCAAGDETSHRKADAAGRKKKPKKTAAGRGDGKGHGRKHGKPSKKSELDVPPPEPAVLFVAVTTVVPPSQFADDAAHADDDDDDDDDGVPPPATAAVPTV